MAISSLSSALLGALVVTANIAAASPSRFHERPPVDSDIRRHNTTHTFKPIFAPKVNRHDPTNLVSTKNVTLSYVPEEEEEQGSIDMPLVFSQPAVAFEQVEAVTEVSCEDGSMTVTLEDGEAYAEAVEDWNIDSPFVLISGMTNKGFPYAFEHGFFIVDGVAPNPEELAIWVNFSDQGCSARPCW